MTVQQRNSFNVFVALEEMFLTYVHLFIYIQNTEDLWHPFISDGETINFLLKQIVKLRLC